MFGTITYGGFTVKSGLTETFKTAFTKTHNFEDAIAIVAEKFPTHDNLESYLAPMVPKMVTVDTKETFEKKEAFTAELLAIMMGEA